MELSKDDKTRIVTALLKELLILRDAYCPVATGWVDPYFEKEYRIIEALIERIDEEYQAEYDQWKHDQWVAEQDAGNA